MEIKEVGRGRKALVRPSGQSSVPYSLPAVPACPQPGSGL